MDIHLSIGGHMKNLLKLLLSFLKVGFIGFGGGSALIPIIEDEVVTKKKLLKEEDYYNHVIVANITPGTLPVKLAAAAGRRISGIPGMIGSALMVSLPGVFITVFLVSIISQLNDNVLSQIEYASVGISVFIILLLVNYINKVIDGCRQSGTAIAGIIIMLLVFVLTAGKEINAVLGLERTPIFDISTLNILLLSFFIIFFTSGIITPLKGSITVLISVLYILCTGKSNIISNPTILTIIQVIMLVLSCYGIYDSIKKSGSGKKVSPKGLFVEELSWFIFLIIFTIPAILIFGKELNYITDGFLSTIMSFGGGEAYLTIADNMFVASGTISSDIFYGQILPIANALPGPILSKILAAIGYYLGFNVSGSIMLGYVLALTGYAVSLAATCTVFSLILYIYNSFENLEIFQTLKKWVLPIVAGLLLSTIVAMLEANFEIIAITGLTTPFAFLLCIAIFAFLYFLHIRFHLHDVILILISGVLSLGVCNIL